MATGAKTYFESAGRAVNVDLLYTVSAEDVLYVDGFLGVAAADGESGNNIALTIDHSEYQFSVPAGLTVVKGNTVYIEVADLTGHKPDDTAYSTTAGAGKVALFKATKAKDVNNNVRGILLPEGV